MCTVIDEQLRDIRNRQSVHDGNAAAFMKAYEIIKKRAGAFDDSDDPVAIATANELDKAADELAKLHNSSRMQFERSKGQESAVEETLARVQVLRDQTPND